MEPTAPSAPMPLGGLSAELRGIATDEGGVNSVVASPDGTRLFAGEGCFYSQTVEIHELAVNGNQVTTVRRVLVGRPVGFGSVFVHGWTPAGDLLISVVSLQPTGPMAGHRLGTFSPKTGAITPIVLPPHAATGRNHVIDHVDGVVYYTLSGQYEGTYYAPLRGGTYGRLTTRNGPLALDATRRQLWISDRGVHSTDPLRGGTTLHSAVALGADIDTLAVDPTENVVFCTDATTHSVYRIEHDGTAILMSAAITDPTAIHVLPNPWTFGRATDGHAIYRWQATPNAGGRPEIGNTAFGLQLTASNGNAAGILLLGTSTASFDLFGANVLVDPILAVSLPANGSVPLPLAVGTPAGLAFVLQSLHFDAGAPQGLAASDALRFVIR